MSEQTSEHSHKCGYGGFEPSDMKSCGHEWSHPADCRNDAAAHTCPNCGSGPWWVIFHSSPTRVDRNNASAHKGVTAMNRDATTSSTQPATSAQITKLFKQLSPAAQRRFLLALAKHSKDSLTTTPCVWLKWRVWFKDDTKINKRDWMYMFARTPQEAVDLSNQCRHRKLQVLDVDMVP